MKSAKEDFIGRIWLYQELESVLNYPVQENGITGVLIIGDPGTGKSALSAQLVCSRTSSRTIHDHILGYHLCKHSDKNTQSAGKFVRNLAGLIAQRILEYGFLVSKSSYILRSLHTDCVNNQDPMGCFEQAVLSPLKSLTNAPKESWYLVIDALDECLTQTEFRLSIVYLLKNKLSRFPSWLKLVMTSRNESSISFNLRSIKKLIIDPEDSRNTKDIELFLTTRFYQDRPLLQSVKTWFGLENTTRLISLLTSKSQGNFLFVKEMIRHWEASRILKCNPHALPETLEELYFNYFQRLYQRGEHFKRVRRILELLVATFHPLTPKEIYDVLKVQEENLEQDYDFQNRMKELGHFLRYGKDDTVTLYHLSLTEWLTSDNGRNGPFYVSRIKGHEALCDFFFKCIAEGGKPALLKYGLPLAQHIASGGWKKAYVEQFLSFPSQVVNSSNPETNRTLLHLAVTINNTDVLELLLPHFIYVDFPDVYGKTPAFLAAEHGLVENLALLVKKGANVNLKTKSLRSLNLENVCAIPDLVFESKSKFTSATMLHAAAHAGYLKVVNFLLENNAFLTTVNDVNLTALQLAAEKGHLEIVKALHKAGGIADQTALHHAAHNNWLNVVKYLLDIGVDDSCMSCDGSFYWLKSSRNRLQSVVGLGINRGNMLSGIQQNPSFSLSEFFDDKHLIYCETALHSAISNSHSEVVKELISRDKRALACQDYSGRTPLHEAVRRNNTEIVSILLKEDQIDVHSTCQQFQKVSTSVIFSPSLLSHSELTEYQKDNCHCGYTPLHLAARFGYWEIALNLIVNNAMVEAKDCVGATPLHIAACHNHAFMTQVLIRWGANINSKTSNGSTPLHSAAACGALDIVDQLLSQGAIRDAADNSNLTALHYSILNVRSDDLSGFILDMETKSYVFRTDYSAKFNHNNDPVLALHKHFHRWLIVFIKLIQRGSNIKAVDIHGRTALHIAAENGLAGAVKVLLLSKSQIEVRDKTGQTPLDVAVTKAALLPTRGRFKTKVGTSTDQLRPYLRGHEMVVYLLLSYSEYVIQCSDSVESLIQRAFINDQLHIAQVIDSCLDAEGFSPLHRAAQGSNVVAIRSLLNLGVSQSKLSPHGYDALTLTLLHAENPNSRFLDNSVVDKASAAALVLLRHKMKSSGFHIVCDPSKAELTLYHLAASRGLVHFIQEIFKDKKLHQLDVDCPNRDGITPMYLAKVFNKFDNGKASSSEKEFSPWIQVVKLIEYLGGKIQYPRKIAEYNLIYKKLYGWIPRGTDLKVRPDIRALIIEFLTTYGQKHMSSLSCEAIMTSEMVTSDQSVRTNVTSELEQQLMHLKRQRFRSRIPKRPCAYEFRRIATWLRKTESLHEIYSSDYELRLFYLTQLWNMEVFEFLRCYKMTFYKYRPHLIDERKLYVLLKHYEDNISLWYLHGICIAVADAFRLNFRSYLDNDIYRDFKILHQNYPDFIRVRLGDIAKSAWTKEFAKSWPLELFFTFTLGLHSQYEYLTILNVGLGPETRILLDSAKLK